MPRPSKSKTVVTEVSEKPAVVSEKPVEVPVAEKPAVVPVAEKAVEKVSKKRTKAAAEPAVVEVVAEPAVAKPVEEVVAEPAVAEVVADEVEGAVEGEQRKRAVHSRETVLRDFSALISLIEGEIALSRSSGGKTGATKTLRRVLASVKDLQRAAANVIKQKPVSLRKNNHSGFLKPVQISQEIAKFTGFDVTQLHSRVDVNNYICEYIKKNNLQNPTDRRQIVPDEKLAGVIGYKHGTDKPLTYPILQQYMTRHYPSSKAVVA